MLGFVTTLTLQSEPTPGKDDVHGSLEDLPPTEQVFEFQQKGMTSVPLINSILCDIELERTHWIPPPAEIDRGCQKFGFLAGVRDTSAVHATLNTVRQIAKCS